MLVKLQNKLYVKMEVKNDKTKIKMYNNNSGIVYIC